MNLSTLSYAAVISISAISIYYLTTREAEYDRQVEPDVELPAFSGKQIDNISFNEKGVRSYSISSSHLDHYAVNGNTIFKNPVFKVFKDGATQEWEMTAQVATLDKDNILVLDQEVVATNLLPEAPFREFTTETMNIELDSRNFWSEHPVEMKGAQFFVTGDALKGNFADNNAEVYKNVQTIYENSQP
ncbi:LPS export ABC transporter periplasmic protein LptC [Vibrio sp.]|nr:LPS export ABC transporter periplasmic protein LptC [Vibrio sp.]